jgi:REP element-mobilizing transposase RayT
MPVRPLFDPTHLYFITTTTQNHAHLFAQDAVKRILVDSLHYLRTTGRIFLFTFVVMPNHPHLIVRFQDGFTLPDVLRDFKKFTSKQVARQLQVADGVSIPQSKRSGRQVTSIWENGYDARNVFSLEFLQQKMDYIHDNPCQPQWKLAVAPEDYAWSSARFYLAGKPAIIPVDDVREYLMAPAPCSLPPDL